MLNTDKIKLLRKAQQQSKAKIANALHMPLDEYTVLENSQNFSLKLAKVIKLADSLNTSPLSIMAIPAEAGANIQAELLLLQIERKRWKQKLLRDIE